MLTALAVVLLTCIVLLAIPLAVTFRVSWPETSRNDVRLRWAFGLVALRIDSPRSGSRSRSAAVGEKKPRRRKRRSGRSVQGKKKVLSVAGDQPFRQRAVRFAGDLWRAVRKDNVRLRARLGLGDPADTGQLWAVVGPVAGLLSAVPGAAIAIEPDFVDPTFEVDGSGRIEVVPIQVIYLMLALLLSPSVWRTVRRLRAADE